MMASIYQQLVLAHVYADGEGGHVLKVTTDTGEMLEFPLSVDRAARLARDLCGVVANLVLVKPS